VSNWKRTLVRTPLVGQVALYLYRTRTALSYYYAPLFNLVKWLFKSNEHTNLTYNLERNNQRYLASVIAHLVDSDFSTILGYMDEAEGDAQLKRHIENVTTASRFAATADREVRFGRRLGWYAFVRATKPHIVVETGVDKGLGACLLSAALLKNSEEGHEGRYFGTDINPDAGYLLSGKYAEYGRILYGDSIETLTSFSSQVDLFINDSDHSADYEEREYEVIAPKLSEGAIVLGDNSHVTDKLLDFSLKHGRQFIFFAEKPADHWYPGGGIGISVPRTPTLSFTSPNRKG
jgi:predicted O-methyltransferase YrrM